MRNPRKNELNYKLLQALKSAVSRDNRRINAKALRESMKKIAKRSDILDVNVEQHDEIVMGAGSSDNKADVFNTLLRLEVYRRRQNGTVARHYAAVCVWPNGYLDHGGNYVAPRTELASYVEDVPRRKS